MREFTFAPGGLLGKSARLKRNLDHFYLSYLLLTDKIQVSFKFSKNDVLNVLSYQSSLLLSSDGSEGSLRLWMKDRPKQEAWKTGLKDLWKGSL